MATGAAATVGNVSTSFECKDRTRNCPRSICADPSGLRLIHRMVGDAFLRTQLSSLIITSVSDPVSSPDADLFAFVFGRRCCKSASRPIRSAFFANSSYSSLSFFELSLSLSAATWGDAFASALSESLPGRGAGAVVVVESDWTSTDGSSQESGISASMAADFCLVSTRRANVAYAARIPLRTGCCWRKKSMCLLVTTLGFIPSEKT